MKHLIIIAALLLPLTTQADDLCMDLAGSARAIMHVRQTGLSAKTQHSIVDQNLFGQDATIMHAIIKDAYTQPLEVTEQAKANAAQNFDVYWLLKCQRAQNGFY